MVDPFAGTNPEDFPPEHLQAIGEFVTRYSALESLFTDTFVIYSGMPPDIARAVIGGMRLKDIIQRIKRLMKLNKADPRAILDFEQIETIIDPLSDFRDKVIHRVWLQSDRGPVAMNLTKAHSLSGIFQEPISTEELNTKIAEVLSLCVRLIPHMLTGDQLRALPSEYRSMLHAPWLDKSSSPPKNR